MDRSLRLGRWALVACVVVELSCSRPDTSAAHKSAAPAPTLQAPTAPNYVAGPPDDSQSVVLHHPRVEIANAFLSAPFRDIPNAPASEERLPAPSGCRN